MYTKNYIALLTKDNTAETEVERRPYFVSYQMATYSEK